MSLVVSLLLTLLKGELRNLKRNTKKLITIIYLSSMYQILIAKLSLLLIS